MFSRLEARPTPRVFRFTLSAADLLPILLAAALTEALLLRLLLRLGPIVPQTPLVAQLAEGGRFIATTALNLAYLLTILVLLMVAWRTLVSLQWGARLLGVALVVALGIEFINMLGWRSAYGTLAFHLFVFFTLVIALGLARPTRWRALGLVLMLAATTCATYAQLANLFALERMVFPSVPTMLTLAETCAVVAVIPFAWQWRVRAQRAWLAWLGAWITAASFWALTMFVGWLPPLLAVWDFAFTLFLPNWVYTVTVGSLVFAVVRGWQTEKIATIGLMLIVLGGLRPDYAYFQHLNWVGFLTLGGVMSSYGR